MNFNFNPEHTFFTSDTHFNHANIDTMIGNTRILSNQLGYIYYNEHQRNGFDASKVVEI